MYTEVLEKSGFDFSLVDRNIKLENKGVTQYGKLKKTGTTICAIMHKTGIILAADTRATAGSVVMDLECRKVHQLAPNIYAAGAGTAADLFAVINMMRSELTMHRMNTGNESRVSHIEHRLHDHLFKHMGHIGVALIIGGIDVNGPDICVLSPHGNTMHVPYTSMGSGSLAALSVLETRYRDGMSEEEAIELAADAIEAGIFFDLGSGSNINIVSVKRNEFKKFDNYRVYNKKEYNDPNLYELKGKTEIISEDNYKWKDIKLEYESINVQMDI